MKIVVVGGVAGGASVAARARRLDEFAEIIVFEKGDYVSFANCGLPYHIGEVITDRSRLLLQTPESLHESLDIDVRVGHEVVSIDRAAKTVTVRELASGREYTESYDRLVLCPGRRSGASAPARGRPAGRARAAQHPDMDEIKAQLDAALEAAASARNRTVHAVVIGAGYIGVEMAENLRHRGAAVTIVELSDQILPPLDKEVSIPVEQHLRSRGVDLNLSTAAAAFAARPDGGVTVELQNNRFLEADLVILSAGVRPAVGLARDAGLEIGPRGGIVVDAHMRTSDPDIWAAGDAVETAHTVLPGTWLTPLAGPANRQGRVAADNLFGRDDRVPVAAGHRDREGLRHRRRDTGASESTLKADGHRLPHGPPAPRATPGTTPAGDDAPQAALRARRRAYPRRPGRRAATGSTSAST